MQEAYLKAPTVQRDDRFGIVALSGEWLAASAQLEDGNAESMLAMPNDNAPDAGVVYMFRRRADGWAAVQYLKASNTREGDRFGAALALQGRTLVVGARLHDGPEFVPGPAAAERDVGAVYVFEADDTGRWVETGYLQAVPSHLGQEFGLAVALDGDLLVVGTIYDDGDAAAGVDNPNQNAPESGAVFVFERDRDAPSGWRQTAYVKAPNADPGDWFGRQVAVYDAPPGSPDRVIVGAAYESGDAESTLLAQNNNMERAGAAYIIGRDGDSWRVTHYLKASNAGADDRYGWSVAIRGDTAVVGAYAESCPDGLPPPDCDDSRGGAGAAYVYEYDSVADQWRRAAFLKAIGAPRGANFGSGIVLSDKHLIIGATWHEMSGAAYLFTCSAEGRWGHRSLLKPTVAGEGDHWGGSNAMDAGTIALGSTWEAGDAASSLAAPNDNANRAGAITLFELR